MRRRCFYAIESMICQDGLHGASFSIRLAGDAVRHAVSHRNENANRLAALAYEDGLRTIWRKPFLKEDIRYVWHAGSWLPQILSVPGNACDLGVSPDEIAFSLETGSDLVYVPHNVDGPLQTYGLMFLWANWATAFEAVTGYGKAPATPLQPIS